MDGRILKILGWHLRVTICIIIYQCIQFSRDASFFGVSGFGKWEVGR